MPSIAGQNVLFIGGSSGIGKGAAKIAAEMGAHVSIASSSQARVDAAVEEIRGEVPNATVRGFSVDVGSSSVEANLQKLLGEVVAAAGRPIDHIAYTAVKIDFKMMPDWTVDFLRGDAHYLMVVPALIAKIAPKNMSKSFKSSITFSSGRLADCPMKGLSLLAGWASGLQGLARTWALDLAPIRVNVVSPGTTDTEALGTKEQRAAQMAAVAEKALLGKAGQPEEVGEAYVYLMRDTNATGTCVRSDGGSSVE